MCGLNFKPFQSMLPELRSVARKHHQPAWSGHPNRLSEKLLLINRERTDAILNADRQIKGAVSVRYASPSRSKDVPPVIDYAAG